MLGLERVGSPESKQLAREIALRWLVRGCVATPLPALTRALAADKLHGLEAQQLVRDAREVPRQARGGARRWRRVPAAGAAARQRGCPPRDRDAWRQIGFGWTNGVVLSFLDRYGGADSEELQLRFAELLQFNPQWASAAAPRSCRGALSGVPSHLAPLFAFGYFDARDEPPADDEFCADVAAVQVGAVAADRPPPVPFYVDEARVPTGKPRSGSPTPRQGRR